MTGSACLVSVVKTSSPSPLPVFRHRQHRAGLGVDDLGVEMVLPDHRAVLGLDAFVGHARAHHFRQAVDVDRIDAGADLDVVAHRLGPGFGAEDADLQRRGARVQPLAQHLLDDHLHVARRDHDDVGPEIGDQLDLLLGLAAGDRDHRAAELLGAVMRAQPAGEQAVAVGHLHDVAGAPARGADRARHQVGPGVDVALRVAHHRRLAGGARAGVHAHDLLARHREHAERVVVAQVLLVRERELGQVGERLAVRRVHAVRIEGGLR